MEPLRHLHTLLERYPALTDMQDKIILAFSMLETCYRNHGKLMLCGNGGSACDCEHIAGELMKGFILSRPLSSAEKETLSALGEEGKQLAGKLQRALPAVVLTGLPGLSSAFANDVDPIMVYAQQAFAYAKPNDVLLGISTSGNAANVRLAAIAAKARGAKILGMTGAGGGQLAEVCDLVLEVPETETYKVQELHLPLYHCLCIMLEEAFFSEAGL